MFVPRAAGSRSHSPISEHTGYALYRGSRRLDQEQRCDPQHYCARARASQCGARAGVCGGRGAQGGADLRGIGPGGPDQARDDPRNDSRGRRPPRADVAQARRARLLVAHPARTARTARAVHAGHPLHGRGGPRPAAEHARRRRLRGHRLRRCAAHDERRRGLRCPADGCAVDLQPDRGQPGRDPDPDPRG